MTDTRVTDIQAGTLAKTPEDKVAVIGVRAAFAVKNYGRLGSSWAEFYGRDIPYLLAQLEARDKTIEAVKGALAGCHRCDYDEAEGDLVNHCEACCRRITTEVWRILEGSE